ncbi:MAG: hypothetical protein LRY51_17595 [Geovibrio sp.]|nr:hypothetical protein [Geovibrio sp.]
MLGLMLMAASGFADDEPLTLEGVQASVDAVQANADWRWTLIAAFMVFFYAAWFRNGRDRLHQSKKRR